MEHSFFSPSPSRSTGRSESRQNFTVEYPAWLCQQFAIENGPVEIVDLPIKNGGSFHSHVNVYQRVIHHGL